MRDFKDLKIAVAGTGYVGLSIATLLSQHHKVMAVDIVPEKVELINSKKSPIQEEYIEKYLAEKDISTDYVFDGQGTEPWQPDYKDYKPLNVYSTNRIDVASPKRNRFAHYMGC